MKSFPKRFPMKAYRRKIFRYLCVASVLYLLSLPFFDNAVVRIGTVLVVAFLPCHTFAMYSGAKEVQGAREQLKSFLEQLCIKVSTGKSLETALLDSHADLLSVYGKDAMICIASKMLEDQVASGIELDEAVLAMAAMIPCPEALPLFLTISRTRHLGNRILQVLRQSLLMVSDLLSVSRDISAEVSQKRLESTVMSIMPFAVLWSLTLTTPSYLEPAFSSPLGRLLMLSSFAIAVTGYCLGGMIVSRSIYTKSKDASSSQPFSLSGLFAKLFSSGIRKQPARLGFIIHVGSWLPEDYRLSMKRTLTYLFPKKEYVFEEYIFIKCVLFLSGLALCLLFRLFIPLPLLPCVLLLVFLLILHDVDTRRLIAQNKAHRMRDFPTFVGLLATLLCNGIVLSKALLLCMDTFKDASVSFQNELGLLRGSMTGGTPAHEALEHFANRCQIPEIACALQFAAQYDRTGSLENLNFLKLQCSTCWLQSKVTARRQLEESSVKLLFPMILQLVCVMVITITPSILSLRLLP